MLSVILNIVVSIISVYCDILKYYLKGGRNHLSHIPLQDCLATCQKYCNFKTIFYQVLMGYPL